MKKLLGLCLIIAFAASAFCFAPTAASAAAAGEPVIIKPMAKYDFADAEIPGKDSSGNGYDLKKLVTSSKNEAFQVLQDGGKNYLSLVSERDADGKSKGRGALLYAPELGNTGKDFSDLITESYTVSLTFRRDNAAWIGDHYTLAVGRYNDAFQITPWKGVIEIQVNNMSMAPGATTEEKQQWLEANALEIPCDTSEWTTVTVSADASKNIVTIYVNGEQAGEPINISDTFFSWREDPYAFTLGAQCQISGIAATCFATVDIKDCSVYNTNLSAENVKKILAGENAVVEQNTIYIKEIEELDTEVLDLLATDKNNINNIISEVLPKKLTATLSNNQQLPTNITWYPTSDSQIVGYIDSPYANASQLSVKANYGYTVRFEYDESLVRVSQIKLDGNAYEPGTEIDSNLHSLSFKATPLGDFSAIDSVSYLDMEWEAESDGTYYLSITGGAHIIIEALGKKFSISYYNGDNELGSSQYSYGGSETLKSFTVEGYTFKGWYTDKELTKEFTAIDFSNPKDLKLYGKYVSESGGGKSGCGGVVGLSVSVVPIMFGALMIFKRNKNNKG